MSMVTGSSAFSNYYSDLLKNLKQATNDQANVISVIKNTLEALSSSKSAPKELKIRNISVHLSELTTKDMKIFIQFTSEFFKNNPLPEKDALEMYEKITLAEEEIEMDKKGLFFLDRIKKTKQDLLLNAKIDSTLANASDSVSKLTVHRISELLKVEQKKGIDLEKQIKKLEKKSKNVLLISSGGLVVAFGLVITSSVLLGLSFFPIALAGIILGGILAGVSYYGLLSSRTNFPINNFQFELKDALVRFERLESYKKLVEVEDKKYVAFTEDPKNEYSRFLKNDESFSTFLDLFQRETQYEEVLEKKQIFIKVAQDSQEKATLEEKGRLAKEIQESYEEINWASKLVKAQRAKMGLDQFPNP